MARTVVGLFENQGDARAAQQDLQTAGFGQDRVTLVSSAGGQLAQMLTRAGVPQEDAAIYNDGVQSGGALIVAQLLPNGEAQQVADILDRHNVVDIGARGRMAQQTTQLRSTSGRRSFSNDYQGGDVVIPIVEEQIRVGKREVEAGGVRVQTHVEERPVNEQVTLRNEEVRVERRPVNQPVNPSEIDNLVEDGMFERTFEVREHDEEAVVAKQARVVEEVVVNKNVEQRVETVQDTVRRTDVDVEQLGGNARTVGQTTTQSTTGSASDEGVIERGASSLGNAAERAVGSDLDDDGDVGRRDPRNNY